jgi:hypothetical protein
MNLTTIAAYEDQFRVSPIGRWTQASGTFSNILNQQWEFNSDYRGEMLEIGIFGEVQSEMTFEWREVAPFTIACKVEYWRDLDEPVDDSEPEEDSEWMVLHYAFLPLKTDVGEMIGMIQMNDTGTPQTGFWWSLQPLMLMNSTVCNKADQGRSWRSVQ